jgi:hypothetical protein
VSKIIRIRNNPADLLQVQTYLPFESYRPGDTVQGTIKASTKDGSAFNSAPTFSYSVTLDVQGDFGRVTS